MSYIKKFISSGLMAFKESLAYKFQFMASIVISPIMLLAAYYMWQAIYANNAQATILGYSFNDMITYYVLSMVIGHFIYNQVGNDLQDKVIYGDLTQDLLKPFSVFSQFMSRTVADRFFAFAAEVLPVFLIAIFIFNIRFVMGPSMLFFAAAVMLSFLINFLVAYLLGLFSFWLTKIESVQWLVFIFIRFFSGEFIPLDFLGPTFLTISKFLPFYYLRYGAIQLALGKMTTMQSVEFLAIQALWIVGLYFLIRLLWDQAMKKYGATGG
jgi:ABC-2 type transport system permease protein